MEKKRLNTVSRTSIFELILECDSLSAIANPIKTLSSLS